MARQGGTSTPIFDELLREMTEGHTPAPPVVSPDGAPDAEVTRTGSPAPRRRHRAD